ncbi:MAG: serine/threonine-protein kinase [Planktothrix sp. GU0601_MAG3]|nr:MAG: serine/threonine-protein kinase [Planktothrix sp. GU0601_MAG3]
MTWNPGKELNNGKYRIEEQIGRGGFSVTYKALHLKLNDSVVIKTPNDDLIKDVNYSKYTVAFIKEAQILKKLPQNLNIVQVTDLFDEEDEEFFIPCIVMDLVPGESLKDIVKSQKNLSEEVALKYIFKIGEALDLLHQNGFVHRDVHPGNIIISDKDKPILIDLGLAIEISPQSLDLNNYGHPQFIAPEQKQGNCQPTIDIYALAATLYYLVTGKYAQESPEKRELIKKIKVPKSLNRAISNAVSKAILKGLELNSSDRPQSMQEWLKMLGSDQTFSVIETRSKPIELLSVCGIDYRNLETVLKN